MPHAAAYAFWNCRFATAIAPIYAATPEEFANSAAYLHEVSGGRFQFGIGIAHAPLHQRIGVTPGRPLADIRDFVAKFRSFDGIGALPPIILAALRKRMVALAAEIAATAPQTGPQTWPCEILDLTGPDLRQAILALAAADVAVSNDSGLLHVAAALGTPAIGIFGPTSPLLWAPLNPLAAVIETPNELPCRPCHKPSCRLTHHLCMRDIAVEQVLAATHDARAIITVAKPR